MGYADQAERLLRESMDRDEWGPFHLADFLLDQGRPAEALLLAEDPENRCWPTTITAEALLALQRWDEALAAYDAAIGRCPPENRSLRIGLARARVGQGDERGARALDVLASEQPEDTRTRRLAIEAWRRLGRPDRVRTQLQALADAGFASPAERRELAGVADDTPPAPPGP
jgi:uncharacterized protein HemY